MVKNPAVNAGDARDAGSIPGLGRSPGTRERLPTPVFWPRELTGIVHGVAKIRMQLSD